MTQSIVEQAGQSGRKYTEKQIALLNEFRKNGFDGKKAGVVAGYRKDSVATALRSLKDELIEIAEMEMVEAAPLAAKTIVDMMKAKKPVSQAKVKLSASQTVLDRVGLGKKDKLDVEHRVSGGIFILPSKESLPAREKIINE